MPTIRPQQPTLDDIKRLAREMGVTLTDKRGLFGLARQEPRLNETYRKNQSGITTASTMLIGYGRLLQDPSARLVIAEEYLRQHTSLYRQLSVETMQRRVKKATSVDLSRQEALDLRYTLSNEEDQRRIEEEENKEQLQMQDSFETTSPQRPGQATTIIGSTSYDAEIELSQSHVEAALMFARKKGRKEINYVVSNVAGEVDLVVLSVKNPRWPRVLEKITLSFEETRIFRDLLVRPDISAWLNRG